MTATPPNEPTEHSDDGGDAANGRPAPRRGPGPIGPPEQFDAPAADDASASTDPTASRLGDLDRRDYLKALGAAGAAASLAGASSAATAQVGDGDWEDDAEDRIEEHRKSDLEVVVEDESGNPVSNADVAVEMQEHDYHFGTAVHAEFLTRGTEWGEELEGLDEDDQEHYAETIEELFNTIVLENHHKWLIWAEDQENHAEEDELPIADEAVEWALERDMDVRGHVCLWGNVDAWAVPPDVASAMGVDFSDHDDFEGIDEDPEYVREQSMAQIERIVEHYGDDVFEWEIVNEAINEPAMIEAVDGDGVDAATAPILGDWYERGQAIAEEYGVSIAVNDFNTLVGPIGEMRNAYEDQIEYLVEEREIDLDGIGFQCHFGYRHDYDQRLDPEAILAGLDRYADYGAGLRATEFDTFEGDQWTQETQAEYLYTFLKTFFSHPDTEQFLVWGHWDPLHWGDEIGHNDRDAPLFEEDWTAKPAYDEYVGLVFEEWWTDEAGTTDADGTFSTSAFLGEHEITVEIGTDVATETVAVTDADDTTTVVVGAEGDSSGDEDPCEPHDADGERLDTGDWVCDLDGDGNYRDLTASGETTTQDLQHFFERQHRDPWNSRPDLFDFTDNGDVGQPDVVDLFHEL